MDNGAIFLIEFSKLPRAEFVVRATSKSGAAFYGCPVRGFWPGAVNYRFGLWPSITGRLLTVLVRLRFRRLSKIYRDFGLEKPLFQVLSPRQIKRANGLYRDLSPGVQSRSDLLNLKVEGNPIGDLAYDSFLKDYQESTVRFPSRRLKKSLRKTLATFVFWDEWLRENTLKGVAAFHTTYRQAMPLRLAVPKNIPTFHIGWSLFHRLTPEHPFTGPPSWAFVDEFESLPTMQKAKVERHAESVLRARTVGDSKLDYLTASPYSSSSRGPAFSTEGTEVVVFAHRFSDSPHAHGYALFDDYWHWLESVGKIATNSTRRWLLKPHPMGSRKDYYFLKQLAKLFPNYEVIPKDVSNLELLNNGLSLGLTMYGSVAPELAFLGIPVISASPSAPYNSYLFAQSPKTIQDYLELLQDEANWPRAVYRQDALRYEAIHGLKYGPRKLLPKDIPATSIAGLSFTKAQHLESQAIERITGFLRSGDRTMPSLDWDEILTSD